MADIPSNTSTTARITGTGQFRSSLETINDSDWWRIDVKAGMRYDFKLTGDGSATSLDSGELEIRDSLGTVLESSIDYYWVSFTAATTGPYYVSIVDGQEYDGLAEGSYAIQSRMDDKVRGDTGTAATITRTGLTAGSLGQVSDSDWYRATASEGLTYGWIVTGNGGANSLDDADLLVRDALGNSLGEVIQNRWISHTGTTNGPIYITVRDGGQYDGEAEGDFILRTVMTDTVRADDETAAVLLDGETLNGTVDVQGDYDWYGFNAVSGRSYAFSLTGTSGNGAINQTLISLKNSAGTTIASDEGLPYSSFTWTATSTGKFYISAGGRPFQSAEDTTGKFTLSVVSNSATLRGTTADQKLTGGAGNTMILGYGGDDDLDGGAGNDRLSGGAGDDILRGGDGIDTGLFNAAAAGTVDLRTAGRQETGYGRDQLLSIENLIGGNGGDRFSGNGQDNTLDGRNGNDTLRGFGGDDILVGGNGNDSIDGGAGIDTLKHFGAASVNVSLAVTSAQNTGHGTDIIRGIENLHGAHGNDRLIGSTFGNEMRGGLGHDRIEGLAGSDTIRAQNGNDTVDGGSGGDVLFGDAGNDTVLGGTGNDTVQGGLGNDLIDGGGGIDQLTFATATSKRVDLANAGAQSTGEGIDVIRGIERIFTGAGNDYLSGTAAANLFSAGDGNDTLIGRGGADRLIGGGGDDRIEGGTGADLLRGDGGVDIFVFMPGDGTDRIQDFQDGNDKIEIGSTITFDNLTITYDFAEGDSRVSFAGTVVVVENLWSGYLTESDFIFA